MRMLGLVLMMGVCLCGRIQAGEHPTAQEKASVRSIVRQIILISRSSSNLDELGKRSLRYGQK
jgi:hypothetical protein